MSAAVINLESRRATARRRSKLPEWFGGIAGWNRTHDEDCPRFWDPLANDEKGGWRSTPFTEVERRKLDMWRAEREKKIQRLIKKIRQALGEIGAIDPIKHHVSYDPLVAYWGMLMNVHYVLFDEGLPPAARAKVLDLARDMMCSTKSALEATLAHARVEATEADER